MVIGSLCSISVEGVIRGLRLASAPKRAKPSHLIADGCLFCPSARPSVCRVKSGWGTTMRIKKMIRTTMTRMRMTKNRQQEFA
jgi:hypothetical protein